MVEPTRPVGPASAAPAHRHSPVGLGDVVLVEPAACSGPIGCAHGPPIVYRAWATTPGSTRSLAGAALTPAPPYAPRHGTETGRLPLHAPDCREGAHPGALSPPFAGSDHRLGPAMAPERPVGRFPLCVTTDRPVDSGGATPDPSSCRPGGDASTWCFWRSGRLPASPPCSVTDTTSSGCRSPASSPARYSRSETAPEGGVRRSEHPRPRLTALGRNAPWPGGGALTSVRRLSGRRFLRSPFDPGCPMWPATRPQG